MHLDPALKEYLFRRTGSISFDRVVGPVSDDMVSVVARLHDPERAVDGLAVVARFGKVVTARVAMGEIARVRSDANVASLKASRRVHGELLVSVPDIGAGAGAPWSDMPRGRGVVVAVLDWGCDFVHANFRRPDGGTRLIALWDQRGGPQPSSPRPYCYGRQWFRDQIDDALSLPDPYGALDYDPALIDPDGQGTHGTHVLDIVAGNGRAAGSARGVAPEADLIFVHLSGRDTVPSDNLGDSVRLLEAVRYAFDLAGDRPIVISMSLGQHGGPHDGSTLFEQGLDAVLAEQPGRAVAMSTGNYFSADVHASGRVPPGGIFDLPLDAVAREEGATEIEIWYPGTDRLALELRDPDGRTLAVIARGEDAIVEDGAAPVATIYHRPFDPNNGDHEIDVFLHPSAPEGRWVLRLLGEEVTDGRIHAWIERDVRATQARFATEVINRSTTTNTVCNGRHTIAVGAYDARDLRRPILPFSSVGPTRDGRPKPDVTAPGGGVRAARSSRSSGWGRTHDQLVSKSGTSMAAPHVAGTIALMFEAAGTERLLIEQTRHIVLSTARSANQGGADERARYGAGMVDAARAVAATRDLAARRGGDPPLPLTRPKLGGSFVRTSEERPMEMETMTESMFEWGPDTTEIAAGHQDPEGCLSWLREQPSRRRSEAPIEAVTTIRKNAFSLTRVETDAIVAALTALSRSDIWYRYAALHDAVALGAGSVHGMFRQRELGTIAGTAQAYHRFLPWHRLFLWDFERLMRAQTGGAAAFIPYWDWTNAAERRLPPWLARVPTSLVQSGSTRFTVARDVTTSTPAVDVDDESLPTRATVRSLMTANAGIDPRTRTTVSTTTYDTFTAVLERLHGPPHVWIGGTMAGSFSPGDFMFFMHHCQVDRLWATWQRRFPRQGPSLTGTASTLPRVDGSTAGVATVLTVADLEFDYDTLWT